MDLHQSIRAEDIRPIINKSIGKLFILLTIGLISLVITSPSPVLGDSPEVEKVDLQDPVQNGTQLNYTLWVNNTGDIPLTNVMVIETYDTNVTFVAADPMPTSGNNTWNFSIININESKRINITVNTSSGLAINATLFNFVNVTCDQNLTGNATEYTMIDMPATVNMTFVCGFDFPNTRGGIWANEQYIYIMDHKDGLSRLDKCGCNASIFEQTTGSDSAGWDIWHLGDYIYGSGLSGEFFVYNDSDGSFVASLTPGGGDAYGVYAIGDFAYMATEAGLRVINISDPANPSLVTTLNTTQDFIAVKGQGNYIYVNDWLNNEMLIYNISTPSSPVYVTTEKFSTQGWVPGAEIRRMFVADDGYVYVVNDVGDLYIVDVSDPSNPDDIAFINVSETDGPTNEPGGGVYVKDDCAFVVTANGNDAGDLYWIDVSNRSNPILRDSYTDANYGYNDIYAEGCYIMIASHDGFKTYYIDGYVADAWISNTTEDNYIGNHIYNFDGTGQTKEQEILLGETAIFKIEVQNDAPEPQEILVKGDIGAGGWTFTYFDSSMTDITSQTVAGNYTTGTLDPLQTITITLHITPQGFPASNVTQASVNVVNKDQCNGSTCPSGDWVIAKVKAPKADMGINKTDSQDPIVAGSTLIYTLNVTNNGPNTAYAVNVTDTLPTNVTFTSASPSASGNNGQTYWWNLGALANSSSVIITINVTVDSSFSGLLNNTVNVTTVSSDTNPGNNSDYETTQVATLTDFNITKGVDKSDAAPGDTLNYSICPRYTGSILLANVTVTDTIPVNTSYVNNSATANGAYNSSSDTLTWLLGNHTLGVPGTAGGPGSSGNMTLNPMQDTYIDENNPTNNYGTNNEMRCRNNTGQIMRPLIQFNLSGIPTGAIIDNATLRMYITGNKTSQTVNIHHLTHNWTETGATWNTYDGVNNWGAGGGDYNGTIHGSFVPDPKDAYKETNITDLVQDWINGTWTNYGIILNGITSDEAKFGSRENTGKEPELVIYYHIPSTPATTVTLGANPLLICSTGQINVTMTVGIDSNVSGVTPPVNLTMNTTGGITASLASGPSPPGPVNVSANSPVTFTYVYNVTPGAIPGSISFSGSPASLNASFANATSNNCLVTPSLIYQVQIDSVLDLSITQINNTAVLSDDILIPGGIESPPAITNITRNADLSVTKADNPDPVVAGGYLIYTLNVTNHGPGDAVNVNVTDTLPANVTFNSANPAESNHSGQIYWWNLGNITASNYTVIKINVTVNNGTLETLVNIANVTSESSDTNTTNNEDTENTTIITVAIEVFKAIWNGTAWVEYHQEDVGDVVRFNLSVHNDGTDNLTSINVTDMLPSCLVYYVGNATPFEPIQWDNNLTWLFAGPLVNCSWIYIEFNATVISKGINVNVVNASGVGENTSILVSDEDNATVEGIISNITLEKRVSEDNSSWVDSVVADPGQTVYWQLIVTNTGDDPLTNCYVNDTNGQTYGPFTLNIGETQTFYYSTTPGSDVNNTATAVGTDSDGDQINDTDWATVNVVTTAIHIEKTVWNLQTEQWIDLVYENVGNTTTFNISTQNIGEQSLTSINITDYLPPCLEYSNNATVNGVPLEPNIWGNNITWDISGSVHSGQWIYIEFNATVISNGTNINVVNVTGEGEITGSETYDEDNATVIGLAADLSVIKTDNPDTVIAGNYLTYTLNITNHGPSDAQNVTVSDTLPPGIDYNNANPIPSGGTYPTFYWNIGTLTAGNSTYITINVTINSNTTGILNNTANVTSDTPDPTPQNNTDYEETIVGESADLSIIKTDSPDPVVAGQYLTYTLNISNNGPSDALNVNVIDTLPSGVTFNSATPAPTSWINWSYSTYYWNLGTLTAGSYTLITINITINSNTTGTLNNTVTVTSDTPDPTPGNNTDYEETVVLQPALLEIFKTVWNGSNWVEALPAYVGSTVRFNISVHNNGTENLINVNITDMLPAGLQYNKNATVNNIPSEPIIEGNNLTWVISWPIQYCHWVYIEYDAIITNTGENINIINGTGEGQITGETTLDTDTASVIGIIIDMDLEKTAWDSSTGQWTDQVYVSINDTLRFNISIHNNGTEPLIDFNITDILPQHLQYINNSSTVNGIPQEPIIWNCKNLTWMMTGPLTPCNWAYIEFETIVIDPNMSLNLVTVNATGTIIGSTTTMTDGAIAEVDITPPTTIKEYSGCLYQEGDMEWISTETYIHLIATDNQSGVKETWYRIWIWDEGNETWSIEQDWTLYWNTTGGGTRPFTINQECYHMIEITSSDILGNIEEIWNQTMYVDGSPPIINKTHPDEGYIYNSTTGEQYIAPYAVIILSAMDFPSTICSAGVEGIFWRYDYDGASHPLNEMDNDQGMIINISQYYNDSVIENDFGGIYLWYLYDNSTGVYFMENCEHILYYFAKDRTCHHSIIHNQTYYVDGLPPDSWLITQFSQWDNYITPYTEFIIQAEDDGCHGGIDNYVIHFTVTGPKNSKFYWNGDHFNCDGNWHSGVLEGDIAFQIRDETGRAPSGKYTIEFYATDDFGNTETPPHIKWFLLDNTPPTTNIFFMGPNYHDTNQWITSETNIILHASDEGSGTKITKYRIDNGPKKTYTAPLLITTEGIHTLHYYSKDWTDTVEGEKSLTIIIDNTPPLQNLSFNGANYTSNNTTWITSQTYIILEGYDNGCGLGKIYYRWGTKTWKQYNHSIILTGGKTELEYYMEDKLGNSGDIQEITVGIDDQAPVVIINSPKDNYLYIAGRAILYLRKLPGSDAVIIGTAIIDATASDTSGIYTMELYIDGELRHKTYNGALEWRWNQLAFAIHTIEIRVYDNFGHSTTKEIKVWMFNL